MKRTILLSTAVAIALATTTGVVLARDGDDKVKRHGMRGAPFEFSDVDLNGDGQLSRDELEAHAKARFEAADTNGDGVLSADELAAQTSQERQERMVKRTERMIKKRDTNGDGVLSFDEMQPTGDRFERMMKHMDANGDGVITEDEINNARAERKAEWKNKRSGQDQTTDQ